MNSLETPECLIGLVPYTTINPTHCGTVATLFRL
jgi:hypothetical protein